MSAYYILFESSSGYALLDVQQTEEIGNLTDEIQAQFQDVTKFGKMVKLKAFQPFTSAENALENINHISEHILSDDLRTFLEMNVPKSKKSSKFILGVIEPALGSVIQEELSIPCRSDDSVKELLRGIRLHFDKLVKDLDHGLLERAQLGLGHSYSRAKVSISLRIEPRLFVYVLVLISIHIFFF